jgi:hypothetical protein
MVCLGLSNIMFNHSSNIILNCRGLSYDSLTQVRQNNGSSRHWYMIWGSRVAMFIVQYHHVPLHGRLTASGDNIEKLSVYRYKFVGFPM